MREMLMAAARPASWSLTDELSFHLASDQSKWEHQMNQFLMKHNSFTIHAWKARALNRPRKFPREDFSYPT